MECAVPRESWTRYLREVEDTLAVNSHEFTEQRMLGYPSNTKGTAALTEVRRLINRSFTVLNNCLDPYDHDGSHWKNHSLTQERRLISMLAERFLPDDKIPGHANDNADAAPGHPRSHNVWGYVTSGGSESNLIALKLACERMQAASGSPSVLVLFTEDAHYSIPKMVRAQMRLPCAEVPTLNDGSIDYAELAIIARAARHMGYTGYICMITLGTTFTGAIDDPRRVKETILSETPGDARVYVHLDAALHGGFYDSCVRKYGAQKFVLGRDLDSLSMSMHKWFGGAIASAFMVKDSSMPDAKANFVPYLGGVDRSISCSRDGFNAPLWLARLAQFDWDVEYASVAENLVYAVRRFRELDVPCWTHSHSIIAVFPKPSEATCQRYQLATSHGLAHLVVVPSASRSVLDEFFDHVTQHGDVDVMQQRPLVYDRSGWGRGAKPPA